MKKTRATGLSLPIDLANKLDSERDDISFSGFMPRILEQAYAPKLTETTKLEDLTK
jgi:hypothetical protein